MTHEQMVTDGFAYYARQRIPYSNMERRLYTKGDTGYRVVTVTGIVMSDVREFPAGDYDTARHYLKEGRMPA